MRLGVPTIDLYQVHWPNPLFPLKATMDGMRRLQDDGIIEHVGVSNFPASRWAKAEALLGRPVLTNQVQFSLARRKPEKELVATPRPTIGSSSPTAPSPRGSSVAATTPTTRRPDRRGA